MIKKDPIVRKHIHAWKKSAQYGNFVRRVCDDCGVQQHATVATENVVPDSVMHLAEADWAAGPGERQTQHDVNGYWPTFWP